MKKKEVKSGTRLGRGGGVHLAAKWGYVILLYAVVSVLVFASDFIPLGRVEDVNVSPAIFSLILLVPLFFWHKHYTRRRQFSSEDHAGKGRVWFEVFALFSLAMTARIPLIFLLGMAFEKTAVIYLIVLIVVLASNHHLGSFGFRSENFARSLLAGLSYYLVYGIGLCCTFFALVYAATGHLVIVGYDLFPSLFVFPFMTLCVGVSEEGLFRGFMQTRLTRIHTRRKAIVVQALLFGVWHFIWHVSPFDPLGMVMHVSGSFIFGLVFGQFFSVSGNLVPLILAHGLVDTIGYGAVLNPGLETMGTLVSGVELLSFLIGMAGLALCTKFIGEKARVSTNP